MTTLTAPPLDLAPRLASADIEDFVVPTGREEEWRFVPMADVAAFMHPDADAGTLMAEPGPHVAIVDAAAADRTAWLPTDRPSAIARAGVASVIQVRVGADESVPEPIVVRLTGPTARTYGHVDVRVGAHARATVVLVHDAGVDASGSIVVEVGAGADLTMLSVIDGPPENVHLWQWHADVGRDARFTGAVITIGGRVVRIMPSVSYSAPGGTAELLGAFLADGPQFLEHRIFVEHDQPHCSSRVVYKGALSGHGAHTVWIGDVLVRREAVGIDTYELNRNLLLDDGPRADSVPNLELETGDVVSAGHASATGRFDDEQLFYLQSRGIPEQLARQLVVRGFFVDVLARIGSEHWRHEILERISSRLGMSDDHADLLRDVEGTDP
ncbi:MAG: SufD family Fe-S cluster assembly protein [Actinomycetota bacterium]|nr:SufD family Fe-S cluster assembly protein [Actinomycetota bacterium]